MSVFSKCLDQSRFSLIFTLRNYKECIVKENRLDANQFLNAIFKMIKTFPRILIIYAFLILAGKTIKRSTSSFMKGLFLIL